MKRRFVLSLCAVLLAAVGISSAQAVVDVALNLRYNDPANPAEGGTWQLVAKTDTLNSDGIVGLSVRLSGLDPNDPATVNGSIGQDINGGALKIGFFDGTDTEFVYGQDPNAPFVADVGLSSGPSNQVNDPLFNNAVWGNASIIATGSISDLSVRPAFTLVAANEDIAGTVTAAAIDLTNVRGDSVSVDGLALGDLQRDFDVDGDDLNLLLVNFNGPGIWDTGDIVGQNDFVNGDDLNQLLVLFNTTQTVPPIAAVPEPTSLILLLAAAGFAGIARKRN